MATGSDVEGDDPFGQFVRESLTRMAHPAFGALESLLVTRLAPRLSAIFEAASSIYNSRAGVFGEVQRRDGDDRARYFYELLTMGVQEGLRSCLYYVNNFLFLEEQVKNLGAQLQGESPPKRAVTIGLHSHALVAEYEAFTVMSRATLDRLNRFFTVYFKSSDRNLYRLARTLRANYQENSRAQSLLHAIERQQHYLDSQISMDKGAFSTERDRLAHREFVSWVTVNIILDPDGSIRVIVYQSGSENFEENAGSILQSRYSQLGEAIIDLVIAFLK